MSGQVGRGLIAGRLPQAFGVGRTPAEGSAGWHRLVPESADGAENHANTFGHAGRVVDERDWFHVVAEQRCTECGMRAGDVARANLGLAILGESDRWVDLLARRVGPGEWRRRPHALAWSALEYGAHVRDVLALFGHRIAEARNEDEPEFGWWDHEAAALVEGYNNQAPGVVAADLRTNAQELNAELAKLDDAGWLRAGTRRPGERFTVEGLARFALHEAHHHRHDAQTLLTR